MIDYEQAKLKLQNLICKQYRYSNIDDVYQDLSDIESVVQDLRNELCIHCKKYKLDYMGACEDCRWK